MEHTNPYKKGGMFEGAFNTVFENARNLRQNMTAAETVLWMHLRICIDGFKFRRQHPIGMYIADFYCHKAKLVIELDGSIHNKEIVKQRDYEKETYLAAKGYTVVRFTNNEVMNEIEEVLTKITRIVNNIQKHSPQNGD